ncbi:RHS repeat-associated core domain-containing protein [Stieleria tagensis]|uniref:RHS repeat-associated core domain-containing protein n=1 Tax=Stieleria tagensis TaxID=2956795 RepID=UPI00209B45F6|nr:RHS repeat-associated core domain-containing protein [Stieleria tagensis]
MEDRRLLAVLSNPSQVLPTVDQPVAVGVGTFGGDASPGAVVLGAAGDLTVAQRATGDSWETIESIHTGLGPQQSLVAERINGDPQTDLVLQSADSISVLHNDIEGGFTVVQTIEATFSGGFASTNANGLVVDFVDGDLSRDLVAVATADDAVLVYPGLAGGTFAGPTIYSTGIAAPTTVIVADVIGNDLHDLVVGHADGSIVFFEGIAGDSALVRRDDLTTHESSSIASFGKGDFDGDGNIDLAVTTTTESFLLFSSADPRELSPIVNGDFSAGLTGWQTEIIGQADGAITGRVNGLGGAAQMAEHESFLTSLQQTFVIPGGATAVSFDRVAIGLDPVAGGVPDAFEVSLLDQNQRSLVATHHTGSTAFYNVSSGSDASLAAGVTVSGNRITLDVTSVPADTLATLTFDLIGNPPGAGSVVTIDNVQITPEVELSDFLQRVSLPGDFTNAVDSSVGDVNGDGDLDLVVVDHFGDTLTVINGNGSRQWSAESIAISGYGSGVSAVAVAPLTASDSVDDIIVTLFESDLALSPIGADVTAPSVTMLDPIAGATLDTFVGTASLRFSEPVRESGTGSVLNLAAYKLAGRGADGVFGSSDDVNIPIDSIVYDSNTSTAVLTFSVAALPLADDDYRLTLAGADPNRAIRDLVGNPIGAGSDVGFEFTVDAELTIATPNDLFASEGETVSVVTTFHDPGRVGDYTATIEWGDGEIETMLVTPAENSFQGSLSAEHVYADDGLYHITMTVTDGANGTAMQSALATVDGVAPTVVTGANTAAIAGETNSFTLATFSDPGFTNLAAGSEETFAVTINWGDGTPLTSLTEFSLTNGSPGILTTGVVSAQHTYLSTGIFTATTTITDDDGLATSSSIEVVVGNSAPAGSACLPRINFDQDLAGSKIASGEFVTDQWAPWGVQVKTHDPINHPAMIFDSARPSGGDSDLGSPHSDFGGPGVGSGGASGSVGENSIAQGNLLIISEDADARDPDDVAAGGTLIFTFDTPVGLDEVSILDLDTNEASTITFFDSANHVINTLPIIGRGDNSLVTIALDTDDVARMEIELGGSGGVSELVFCRDLPTVEINGAPTVVEGSTYTATLASAGIDITNWQITTDSNTSTPTSHSIVGDAAIFTTVFPDGNADYRLVGWATDGKNVYPANELLVRATNVDPLLIISGESTAQTREPYTLNLESIDPGDDTLTRWQIDWGDGQTEIVSGNLDSITHRYSLAGNYSVSATGFDEDNSSGSGGFVGVEAEDYAQLTSGSGEAVHSTWTIAADADASGEAFVQATPNTGTNVGDSTRGPRLDYPVSFDAPGTYYIWLRMLGDDDADDSVHIGLDGIVASYGKHGMTDTSGDWHWEQNVGDRGGEDRVSINVPTAGSHTLNLWMREDGVAVDKIVLTRDPDLAADEWGRNAPELLGGYLSNTIDVTVTANHGRWIPSIDFAVNATGVPLVAGDRIGDQFAAYGMTVSTNDPNKPAMIFDSSAPTGGDSDLGTPNRRFDGPGLGNAGATNTTAQGNILIISEDNDAADPDDNAAGGVLVFDFEAPVMLDEIGLLDVQSGDNRIDLLDADGRLISSTAIRSTGDNGYRRVALDALGVSRMEIHLAASGAVTDIEFCRGGGVIPVAPTRFYVSDSATNAVHRYNTVGTSLGDFQTVAALNPRGTTTTGTGNPIWIVSEEGANERVYIYDTDGTTRLGDWTARGLESPEGIATDGTDIWIVDDGMDKVKRYADAASRTAGQQVAVSEFQLAFGNRDPRGITTDGQTLWIVDGAADRVFAYEMDGRFVNWWDLDPANASPAGITINPAGGDGVWVVDDVANAVYHYSQATLDHQGSQTAIGTFALSATNTTPTGIADPVEMITPRQNVVDQIAVAGEVNEYLIDLVAGQEIYVDFNSLSGAPLTTTLIAPDSSVVLSASGFSAGNLRRGPLVATQTGTYTYRLNGNATNTPSYNFTIWDVDPPETIAIEFDTVYAGDISTPAAVDNYTFTGNLGDSIYFDVLSFSNGYIHTELTAPDGSTVFSSLDSSLVTADEGPLSLTQSGTYRLAWRGSQDATPNYSFQINLVPPPEVTAIAIDQVYAGSIETTGAEDHWEFTADIGQQIYVDTQTKIGGSLTAKLLAPDGSTVFSASNLSTSLLDAGPFVIDQAGTYSLQYSEPGGGRPQYSFQVWDVAPSLTAGLPLGEIVSGEIETPGTSDTLTFDASAGAQIFLDMQQIWQSDRAVNETLRSQLFAPSGTLVAGTLDFLHQAHDTGPITLSESGTYSLVLSGSGDNIPGYQLRVDDVTPAPASAINVGQVISDAIEIGGRTHSYNFATTTGTELTLDVLLNEVVDNLGRPTAGFTLLSPAGVSVFQAAFTDTTFMADETGVYTLIVDDRDFIRSTDILGKFSFRILDDSLAATPAAAELTVSNVVADVITIGSPATVSVSWTVTNNGTAVASAWDADSWIDRVFLSADEASVALYQRAFADVTSPGDLAPGESYNQTATITLPEQFEGSFWVDVETDPLNHVFEADAATNNQTRSETFSAVYAAERAASDGPPIQLAPQNGSRFPTGTNLALSGNVGSANQSINAIFMIDVSTSTLTPSGLDVNGDGVVDANDDYNQFAGVGDVLDAELAAALRLTEQLQTLSDNVRVASVLFAGGSEPLDAGPELFNQNFVDPSIDTTYRGDDPNFEIAVRSLWSQTLGFLSVQGAFKFRDTEVRQGTEFEPAIRDVQNLIATAQPADRTLVYLLTDGVALDENTVGVQGVADQGIEFYAFQIGDGTLTPELVELTAHIDADPSSTGVAIAVDDPTELSAQLLTTVDVESVLVNGVPVDALDPAGNFFTAVTLSEGANRFDVIATRAAGSTSQTSITLFGDSAGPVIDLAALTPAAGGIESVFTGTTFNRATNQLHTQLAAGNHSPDTVTPPMVARLTEFSTASIAVSNPEIQMPSADSQLAPAFVFDTEIAPNLPPGSTSTALDVSFANPLRERFEFDVSFDTFGNSAPAFTTVPVLIAPVDTPYTYVADGVDPEGDVLTRSLLQAPGGMALDGNTLTWTPTAADVGHHNVLIEIDDGRGGSATQSFTLLVPSGLDNNPPLILSTPARFATVDQRFEYNIVATDPEGSAVTLSLDASAPAGAKLIGNRLTWTPDSTQLGTTSITILASDSQTASGRQTFDLNVLGTNTAPTFISDPVLELSAGQRYFYAAVATDPDDAVTYRIDGPVGMSIGGTSGVVSLPAASSLSGTYPITITATDARGLSTDQSYTLTVSPDTEAPRVSIILSNDAITLGDSIDVRVAAKDNVAVSAVELIVDGIPVALSAEGTVTLTPGLSGIPRLIANATDTSGNLGTASEAFFVIDPSDVTPPTVSIESLSNHATIEYFTDVIGTVTDNDSLAFYRLEVALVNTNQWKSITSVSAREESGPIDVVSSLIGIFDPTLLKNNQYDMRLTASDLAGNQAEQTIRVALDGMAKVGVNNHPIVDLTIPVAGGPAITIQRQHSQLNADESSDFGNGWQFCAADPDLREAVARTPYENLLGQFAALPFADGDKVYITTPDCQRVGFTFSPIRHTGIWTTLSDSFYDPRWIPDPGVTWQLYGENDYTTITSLSTGQFDLNGLSLPLNRLADGQYIIAANFASYNPLGYELVSKTGVRYSYDQQAGLENVVDRNGNTLQYSDDAITSSSSQQVQFQRDDQGRVTKIIDPDGYEYDYRYDAAGNLVDVQYPNGLSNTYAYTADNYLAAVNPDDLPEQEVISTGFEYDIAGRLTVVTDALGASNLYEYQLDDHTRVTYDALGAATEMEYDDRGNMIRETSANGNTALYQYDGDDNLTVITDERGFETVMTYDENRNITSVTDALLNLTQFSYDAFSEITQMIQADGGQHAYTRDDAGNIVRMQMPGGTDATIEYDEIGRVIKVTDIDGGEKRLEYSNLAYPIKSIERDGTFAAMTYDSRGKLTSMTDHNQNTRTFVMDQRNRPQVFTDALGGEVNYSFNGMQLDSITDQVGNTTTYLFDANNRPVRITDPEQGVIEIEYDANGRILEITDPNGNPVRYDYREDGRLVSMANALEGTSYYEYDATGNQTAFTDPNGNRWQWEYDAIGYAVAEIDPNLDRTEFEFDSMGNLVKERDSMQRETRFVYGDIQMPVKIINAAGDEMIFSYDWQGNLLSEQDFNQHTHSYEYDLRNRLTKTTDPLGNSFQYNYDDNGNRTHVTDKRSITRAIEYDELNRPVKWTDPTGAVERLEYDAKGRVIRSIDASNQVSLFEYDGLDRVVEQTDPLTGTWTWDYDAVGNVVSVTDPIDRTTTATYDNLNRRLTMTDPRSATTRFQYDHNGNVVSVQDPVNNETAFAYDNLGRIIRVTDSLGQSSFSDYDQVGNLVEVVDRNGRRIEFSYDLLDRLDTETWWQGTSAVNHVQYRYDAVGNLLGASDVSSQYSNRYDALNRVLTVDNAGTANVPHVVLSYVFDAAGNRTAVYDNTGVTVTSEYDSRNQLAGRTWSGGSVDDASLRYDYDPRGLISTLRRFQSVDDSELVSSTNFQFDVNARLTDLTHRDAADTVLVDYDYTRDLANQLIQEIHHGRTFYFARDASGQLLTASIDGILSESYQYDQNGNRLSDQSVTEAGNRLQADSQFTYRYDPEGNLTRKTDKLTLGYTDYSYDHRNRLVLAQQFDSAGELLGSVANTFDVFDRLITRSHDPDGSGPLVAQVRHTLYDGAHTWADFDDSNAVSARYLYNDGVDQIAARWRPGEGTTWYLTDRLGTVRELIDDNGAVVNQNTYDSFGQIQAQSNPVAADRFTYTGREWDDALGLFYYRARFYDPANGRFISQDPIGFASGDTNLYRYVGNNPLDYVDPSGNLAISECAVARGAMAAVDTLCPAIQLYLKGEFDGKTGAEAGAMTALQVLIGGEFRTTKLNADGIEVPIDDAEMLSLSVEKAMHVMNVVTSLMPGGAGMAFQLTMQAVMIKETAVSLAGLLSNANLFSVMGQAETWIRSAYELAKDPNATFGMAINAATARANEMTAVQWSEAVCGAANLALMVFSARARCFVAGTPVVVGVHDAFPPSVANLHRNQVAGDGFTLCDAIGGAALVAAFAVRDRRRRMEKPNEEPEPNDSLGVDWMFATTAAEHERDAATQIDDELLTLLATGKI